MYLEAKRKSRKVVFQARCKVERNRFAESNLRNDQKCEVFKIGKRMIKTNENISGRKCKRKSDGVLTGGDNGKK